MDGRQCKREIEFWGLPNGVLQQYQTRGIKKLYAWQAKCIAAPGVLDGTENLVYSAPTSGGKTLVSEIILFRKLASSPKKKVLIILPYVSLVRDKTNHLRTILKKGCNGVKIKIQSFSGNTATILKKRTRIIVSTIEKADKIINQALQDKQIEDYCVVVIDEIHLIGDPSRGARLEMLITKLLVARHHIMKNKKKLANCLQLVAMSATLPKDNLRFLRTRAIGQPDHDFVVIPVYILYLSLYPHSPL